MKNYEKYSCSWSKIPFFRYLFATGLRHHVTICYLKKGQSPPQGNEPFFDPFSGTVMFKKTGEGFVYQG
jgi:hypothetical protein